MCFFRFKKQALKGIIFINIKKWPDYFTSGKQFQDGQMATLLLCPQIVLSSKQKDGKKEKGKIVIRGKF